MKNNIVWHSHPVNQIDRATMKSQNPVVIWFTGLSASGKSTIAGALEQVLTKLGYHTYLLDGDNVRHGLCKDLDFSEKAREENIRRVGEVSKLMVDAGLITVAAFISPFRNDRDIVRNMLPAHQFIEVFVDAPIDVCRQRDPKGLYSKADRGEIKQFTGIDSPYETPEDPEVHIHSDKVTISSAVNQLLGYLDKTGTLCAGYSPLALEA